MEKKELELFKRAWQFLVREKAAARGFRVKSAVISEVREPEEHAEEREPA